MKKKKLCDETVQGLTGYKVGNIVCRYTYGEKKGVRDKYSRLNIYNKQVIHENTDTHWTFGWAL